MLDGSRTSCDWRDDADAVQPGLFGPRHLPHLYRSDYVTNSNDSYWLSNPAHPLEGYARIIGDERTPRTPRTRVGLVMTENRTERGMTRRLMQREVFSDRQFAAALTLDDLLVLCRRAEPVGTLPSSSGPVAIGNACRVLARWDRHENIDSRGAILFRRFWDNLIGASQQTAYGAVGQAPWWRVPFDADHPVRTPRGLNTTDPEVAMALGDAIADLRDAELPLGVPQGKVQFIEKNGVRYPIPGGIGTLNGDFNAIWTSMGAGQGRDPARWRVVVRAGRHLERRAVPQRPDDPHLLGVDRPDQSALRGPNRAVLAEEVGEGPVLRRADQGRTGP